MERWVKQCAVANRRKIQARYQAGRQKGNRGEARDAIFIRSDK
jgi:hypothetical protein